MYLFSIIAYTALIITLVCAAYLDYRYRQVSHSTWVPLILIGGIPMLCNWSEIWPSQTLYITFVLCVIIYIISIRFPHKLGGADAIAIIMVSLMKPIALGYTGMFWLLLFTFCIILMLSMIPKIRAEWDERGIPFLVPLLPAAILVILLPINYP